MIEATIFLVEEDNDGRPALRENLKNNGYNVTLAIDEEDALDRGLENYTCECYPIVKAEYDRLPK